MRKRLSIVLFIISIFLMFGFYSTADPFISKLKRQLEKFGTQFPQEKIYVHTDRAVYAAGEDIWFKVYLRDASSMQLSVYSTIAHVELINEKKLVIQERFIFITEGSGIGDILLDENLVSGNYTLRAYTSFMQNFDEAFYFKKNITIIGKSEKTEKNNALVKSKNKEGVVASFFPEGGDLIDGIASRVGFKVVDQKTNTGIKVDGQILDSAGKTVAYMKTAKFGLGVFNLTPTAEENYKAELEFNGKNYSFPLPKVQTNGYVMQVNNRDVDSVTIKISTNLDTGLGDLYLVGQMRGSLFYAGKINSDEQVAKTYISKDSLPDGIAQLTIFSGSGEPLCERLIYIERPENEIKLRSSTDKKIYSTREKVNLNLAVRNFKNFDVEADLSVTVTNSDLAKRQTFEENIKSWMLLNSDLKGKIEEPGFYFSNNKKSTKYVLDILMMTQGWRRFTWKKLNDGDFPEIKHLPEIGFNLKGHITKKDGSQRQKSKVYLSVLDEAFKFEEIETDAQGNFLFPNLHLFDSTTIVLQARKPFDNQYNLNKKKEKKEEGKLPGSRLLDIYLKNPFLRVEELAKKYNNDLTKEEANKNLIQFGKMEAVKKKYDGWSIELDDINVTAKRKPKKDDPLEKATRLNGDPRFRVQLDSILFTPITLAQLLQSLPGVRVQGSIFQEEIFIVSKGRQIVPTFVVDGTPVDLSYVQVLDPSTIHFMDVYDRAPVQYSVDGGGAAILIHTRINSGVATIKKADGIIHVIHPGYYKARAFYFPDHEDKTKDPNRPDYRTTLYWNGTIKTDPDDNNEFSFFTCDQVGAYDVIIEGMTKTGIPIYGKHQINVE